MIKAAVISMMTLGMVLPAPRAPSWPALAAYYRCEAAAARGALTDDGWRTCFSIYTHLKLRLVGLDPERFLALPREARAEANRQGFRAFRAWEAEHPEAVARLKAEASAAWPS